jgi:hypothetical protein
MTWYIYTLGDPDTRLVRYVGKTNNVPRRVQRHIRDAQRGLYHDHENNWLRSVLSSGSEPVVSVLETGEGEDTWQEREKFGVAFYRAWGGHLTNHHDGGLGGFPISQETREKMSRAAQGRVFGPEIRTKISESNKGKHDYLKGRVVSQSTRDAQSASLQGHEVSQETRNKISESKRGILVTPMTPDIRAKISAANKGREVSEETRQKISATKRKRTEERSK